MTESRWCHTSRAAGCLSVRGRGPFFPPRGATRGRTGRGLAKTRGSGGTGYSYGEGIQLIQKSPVIDLGTENVNTSINLTLGQDRWVLFVGGPLLGPAVLFWGVLIVVVLVSIGLGRVTLTPLKTWQWILLLEPGRVSVTLVHAANQANFK